ncbi:MAG: hypothetical protein IIV90_02195 [Oscillospiraceae bacterium]|nr:hypothetical protein [Oscillospiraceae bacterium]
MVLRDTLKERGYICGLMLRLVRNPAVCCLQKNAGMDFLMLDCEHGNYSMETLHDLFIMARGMGIGAMVRLPEGTKTWVSRVLDAGAAGFLVPYCETREQVETLVYYAKYKPVGNRGFCPAGGHTNYAGGAAKDILPYQNDRVIAMAQIESKKAVDNIDELASVEGLDALFMGPADLSISLGVPGEVTHPLVIEAIQKVVDACKRHNLMFGMQAGDKLLEMFADDLQIIMNGDDSVILQEGFKKKVQFMQGLKNK